MAEGHAAVHAASALVAQLVDRPHELELAVVVRALGRVPVRDPVTLDLQEASQLAHQAPVSATASSGRGADTSPLVAARALASSSSARSRSTRL